MVAFKFIEEKKWQGQVHTTLTPLLPALFKQMV